MQGRCILDQNLRLNKLSRVGGWVGGWLEKLGIRLSQLPTKLKLKLKLSLAICYEFDIFHIKMYKRHEIYIQLPKIKINGPVPR